MVTVNSMQECLENYACIVPLFNVLGYKCFSPLFNFFLCHMWLLVCHFCNPILGHVVSALKIGLGVLRKWF